MRKYYVDYKGAMGFENKPNEHNNRQFDSLSAAKFCCEELNKTSPSANGYFEHYEVRDMWNLEIKH